MGPSAAEHCLSRREMQLSGNEIERNAYGYVVPFFVLFGTMGNIVSLMVLLSPPMRSRSRNLCFLAIVDILFLLLIIPHSLANYEIFAYNYYFRQIYLNAKVHLLAFSNWISAVAIWLVLLICMERLLGVRYPLQIKKYSTAGDKRLALLTLAFIVTATGLLTMYTHISYHTLMKMFCNGTQPHALFIAIDSQTWPRNQSNPNPIWLQRFAYFSTHVHAMLVVFIPTLIIIVANVALLATLKQRSHMLLSLNGCSQSAHFLCSQAKIEQKITYAVCAIVTCFTITQAPSALVPTTLGYLAFGGPIWKHNLQILTNCMVVIGKSLNFALFCLSSDTFRQRLTEVCRQKWRRHDSDSRKFTALMGYTNINSSTRKTTQITLVEMPPCRVKPNKQSEHAQNTICRSPSSLCKQDLRRVIAPRRRAFSMATENC